MVSRTTHDTLADGSRILRLDDGRRVGLLELGEPDGAPVFYLHGFPASRLEVKLVEAGIAATGTRLIALDRPGFGRSDPAPSRSFQNWAIDLATVADLLGLKRFALLGVSGGGPSALACARWLPERVSAAAIVCGLGPLTEPGLLAAMQWPARCSFGLLGLLPWLARPLFGHCVGPLLGRFPGLALRLLSVATSAADLAVIRSADQRRMLEAGVREAFHQGGAGALAEMELLAAPWGFDPADIKLPVQFWHGRDDATVPCSHSEFLAGQLPLGSLQILPAEGHFSLPIRHAATILKTLINQY